MLLLDIADIQTMIATVGLQPFYIRLFEYLTKDFTYWQQFQKSERHAFYVPNGVIELMPICNDEYYTFKYVNGHPLNSAHNRLTVVAFGTLADVSTGYPLMICPMTILTALRTAAISALASQHLAKKHSKVLAMIGCGSQSEFQVLAHHALFDITEVRYFDVDTKAMQRFAKHMDTESFTCLAMSDIQTAIQSADIIITATAAKGKQTLIQRDWLQPGQHLAGIGGDSAGKTEWDPEILKHSKLVVEYFPQTVYEGEIQNLSADAEKYVYAEIWEIISGLKPGRTDDQEITAFDSVGFALEDFSILRLCYQLAQDHQLGRDIHLIPDTLQDCKNLYGLMLAEK